MRLTYDQQTDSLYIDLSERVSVESREVTDGVVLDYDELGQLVGIDIDHASERTELGRLVLDSLPTEVERIAG